MGTIAGYHYQIMNAGSGILQEGQSPSAKMSLKVAWADATYVSKALRGWTQSGGLWTAGRPMQHPVEPMFCTDTSVKPLGAPTGTNKWRAAIVEAVFKPTTFADGGTGSSYELIEESLDFSAEMVDLGSKGWKFNGSTEAVDKPMTKIVPMISYNITVYHASSLPLTAMYGLLGKLNNGTFKGAAAEMVLYAGASATRKVIGQNTGVYVLDWQIQHKFLYSARNLNSEWRASTGAFEKVVGASSVTKFETGDFSTLNLG